MLNKAEVTQKCLTHIRNCTPEIYEIIIVADDSTPQTLWWLVDQHLQGVRLVLNRERMNFSGAVNMGIKVARGRYIAIITNDVYVRAGWLEPLLVALKVQPQYGWVASRLVQKDQALRPFNIACCLIDKEALEKVGLLDEAFRAGKGFEDDDWYWRFLKAGYKPHGVYQSIVDSPEAETTFGSTYNKDRLQEMHRTNQEVFYQKWGFVGTVWGAVPYLNVPPMDRYDWLRRNAEGNIIDIGSAGGHTFRGRVLNFDLDLYKIPNFVRGDAHNMPFTDKSFDTAALGDVMEHVDDPVQVLQEAGRVAGKVLLTVPNELQVPSTSHLMSEVYEKGGETHKEAVERWIRDNKPTSIIDDNEHPHLFHRRFYTEEMLKQHLEAAGLEHQIDYLNYSVAKDDLSFFVVIANHAVP